MINDTLLEEMVTADPKLTTEEMPNILGCSVFTIKNHLYMIGKSYKTGVWVPHKLTEKNKPVGVSVCQSLILKNNTELFLKRIVTGDKKWILFHNSHRKNQWLSTSSVTHSNTKTWTSS